MYRATKRAGSSSTKTHASLILSAAVAATIAGAASSRAATVTFNGTQANKDQDSATHKVNTATGFQVQNTTTVGLADGMDQWVWNTSNSIWAGGAVYAVGDNVVFGDNQPNAVLRLSGNLNPAAITFADAGGAGTNYWLLRGSGGTSADWDYQTSAGVNLSSSSPFGAGATTVLTLDTGFNGVVRLRGRANGAALGGNTIIRSGILEINDALALPGSASTTNAPPVTLDGGELRINVNANNSNPAAGNLTNTLNVLSDSTLSNAEQWRITPFVAPNAQGASVWNGPVSLPAGVTLTLKSYTPVRINLNNMNLNGALGTIRLTDEGSNVTVVGVSNQNNADALNAMIDLGTGQSEIMSTIAAAATGTFDWGALTGGANTKITGSFNGVSTTTFSIGARGDSTTFSGIFRDHTSGGIAALTKVGTGTLTLAGANTHTGATTVTSGTLALAGAAGAITSSPITVQSAATLRIDNTTTSSNDRIGAAAPISLNQGNVVFVGNLAAGTAEAAGALNITGGSNVVSTQAAGVGAGASIGFSGLTQTGGVVDFRPSGGVNIGLPGATPLTNGLIGAWATTNGSDWATLDGSNNVAAYSAYTTDTAANTWAGTQNINLTAGGTSTVAAPTTVNSLRIASGNVSLGATLSLGTGGLLVAGTTNPTISGAGGLTAGTGGAATLVANVADAGNTLTVSAPINDNGGAVKLVKAGPGKLFLSGSGSTYSGGTELIGGTLQVGVANFFPAGSNLTINYGTAFDIGGFDQTFGTVAVIDGSLLNSVPGAAAVSATTAYDVRHGTISANLAGAAALTKTSSAGTVTLTGANTYTGGTTVTNGTLVAGAVGALPAGGAVTVNNGSTLNVTANQSVGVVTLGNAATSGGTIGGTAALTATSFDLQNGTVNAVLAGNVGVTKAAFNTTVTLNGLNTYTGPTTLANITGGTLAINSVANGNQPSALGASSNLASNLVLNGTQTLSYVGPGGQSTDRLFTVNGNPILANNGTGGPISFTNTGAIVHSSGNLTLSGSNTGDNIFAPAILAVNNAGQLTKTGAGTWVLTNNANDFGGSIFVNGGTLSVATLANGGVASPIGAGTTISMNGGTLRYTGAATGTTDRGITFGGGNAGGLESAGTGVVTFTNTAAIGGTTTGTLRLLGTNTGDNVLAAGIGGAIPVTKSGAGKWRLTGANTSTGATTVNGGTLEMDGSQTTTASVTVSGAGAKLALLSDNSHNRIIKTGALAISGGGSLDLSDNKLLTTTAVGTANGSGVYNGVQGMVQAAYDFGAWDLPGLTTSQPNAGQNAGPLSGTTTIGVATAEQVLFIGPADTTTFQGQTVTGATTIAMYTYAGDVNFDGLVDGADYGTLDNWIQFPGTSGYANGDVNYDGVIDGADYGVLDNTIQLQGDPFPGVFGAAASGASTGASLSGVTAVPEASACGFAVLGAAALLGRRRRRSKQD